jgi:hypothetical protein
MTAAGPAVAPRHYPGASTGPHTPPGVAVDWNPPKAHETWVLDDVFDREKGWFISEADATVMRGMNDKQNRFYTVTVGRIQITTYEQHYWGASVDAHVSAGRLCASVQYTGVTITSPQKLLAASYDSRGLPSFGLNSTNGQPTLQTAFPIAPGYPVDLARRQLMVCIGLLAEQAEKHLTAWNAAPAKTKSGGEPIDWTVAANVAGVAGKFLRGFVGF